MNKKQRINYFKERVNYYFYDFFKMVDYELNINKQTKPNIRASTYWHSIESGSGMITICYSIGWIKNNVSKKEINKVAFHEVCEAILWELNSLCITRFICEKDITNATHRIIRRFENTIYPLIKENLNV